MAFSVNEFRSNIIKQGGLANTNKFFSRITIPSRIPSAHLPSLNSKDLSFFCDSTVFPGKNIRTFVSKRQGYGDTTRIPVGREDSSISLSFYVDSQYKVLEFFRSWIGFIIEDSNQPANTIMDNNRSHREISYYEDFVSPKLELFGFSNSGTEQGIRFDLFNCYPLQVGDIQIGWEQNDQIMRVPIEFTFTHQESHLIGTETPKRFSPSGIGMFSRIAQLASIAGVISTIKIPRNIQDLVNQISTVQTVLKVI